MRDSQKLESIKATLRRIYELSERGVGGEKEAALKKLQTLLAKHNLTLEELTSPETVEVRFEWDHEWEHKLLIQIICMVKNVRSFTSWKVHRKPRACLVKLTPAESVDAKRFYKHYRKVLAEQMDDFFTAFCHRNQLYSSIQDDTEPRHLTREDIERLERLLNLARSIEPKPAPRALLEER